MALKLRDLYYIVLIAWSVFSCWPWAWIFLGASGGGALSLGRQGRVRFCLFSWQSSGNGNFIFWPFSLNSVPQWFKAKVLGFRCYCIWSIDSLSLLPALHLVGTCPERGRNIPNGRSQTCLSVLICSRSKWRVGMEMIHSRWCSRLPPPEGSSFLAQLFPHPFLTHSLSRFGSLIQRAPCTQLAPHGPGWALGPGPLKGPLASSQLRHSPHLPGGWCIVLSKKNEGKWCFLLGWVSKESDGFHCWYREGGGGRALHPGEDTGVKGWRTRGLPAKMLDWLISLVWVLLHIVSSTVVWEILGMPILKLHFYIGDYRWTHMDLGYSLKRYRHLREGSESK